MKKKRKKRERRTEEGTNERMNKGKYSPDVPRGQWRVPNMPGSGLRVL